MKNHVRNFALLVATLVVPLLKACDDDPVSQTTAVVHAALSLDETALGWRDDGAFGFSVPTSEEPNFRADSVTEPFVPTRAFVSVFEATTNVHLEDFEFSISAAEIREKSFHPSLPRSFDQIDVRMDIQLFDASGRERLLSQSISPEFVKSLPAVPTAPLEYSNVPVDMEARAKQESEVQK